MPDNDLAMRRRRALYRATHRGSKELDFLLGRYAEQTVETMSVIDNLPDGAPDRDPTTRRLPQACSTEFRWATST